MILLLHQIVLYILDAIFWKEKVIMIIDDKIRYEKLEHYINRETVQTLALSSGKIDKYQYLTGKDILPFNKS